VRRVLIVLMLALTGMVRPASAPAGLPAGNGNLFSHFWGIAETLRTLETKSYRRPSLGSLIEEGLRAMVNAVDAHSAFFSPRSYQSTVEFASGHFAGIGVSIMSKETSADSLLIVDTVRGGPADEAGLKSGDAIVKIDGQRLRGLTSDEVVIKLKGKAGTQVRITVIRDKKPFKCTAVRRVLPDRTVYAYHFAEQRIAYIALKSFSDRTPQEVATFLTKAYARKDRGIILDLRKNPGGVVEAAVKMARLFLPDGSLVACTKNNKHETVGTYTTSGTPLYDGTLPVIVLVDTFTASAAEIITGSFQHYARTQHMPLFVVGMSTYGKGSVQEIIPLTNGCAIKLTTLLYYLPSGQCIQATGITPDIVVKPKAVPEHELKWIESLHGKEVALTNHITRAEAAGEQDTAASGGHAGTPADSQQGKDAPTQQEDVLASAITGDYVVQTAVSLLQVWRLGRLAEPEALDTHEKAIQFLKRVVPTEGFGATAL